MTRTATAVASPNIALIKYWGNLDPELRLPSNGSISMTLGGLQTRTRVTFSVDLPSDQLTIQGKASTTQATARVSEHLDRIRALAHTTDRATVDSESNFPSDAGIASSAAAFAALTLAATAACGLSLDPPALSRLARRASGSACRSIYAGYVEWPLTDRDEDSVARPLAPPDHWPLTDLIAVVDLGSKVLGSTDGHALATTSPLQAARVADSARRLTICRQAILQRDFPALAKIVELDSLMMHAVMMTSTPSLLYWLPSTVDVLRQVSDWRRSGLSVCTTIDAGPNVHCLCTSDDAPEIESRLLREPGVKTVLRAYPGPGAALITAADPS